MIHDIYAKCQYHFIIKPDKNVIGLNASSILLMRTVLLEKLWALVNRFVDIIQLSDACFDSSCIKISSTTQM